jgi:DNA-binding LacI/PurR family transcriptional regulator
MESFEETVRGRGLRPIRHTVGDASWSCESGYRAMRSLLGDRRAPTAVFASNDRLAIGAMRAVVEAGLRVPDDISVVGVDDIEMAAYVTPPLTTVRQRLADVATLGTKILLDLVRGLEAAETQVVFEPELVVRGSTASTPTGRARALEGGA